MDDPVAILAIGGLVGGLVILARGLGGYGSAARVTDTTPSRIASIAVGEVLVAGVVEPAELTLVSPLQSTPCVYYRSAIASPDGEGGSGPGFAEERAVGFRVRDDSGDIRVFPAGGRFDVPVAFDERSGWAGDAPPGLAMRSGPAFTTVEVDRDAAIAQLLSVQAPAPGGDGLTSAGGRGSQRYTEARIEPGDMVTVVGRALPFDQLADPEGSDMATGLDLSADAEVAADLAAARASGSLLVDPEEAWGNAAIEGFGIGRPVRPPELHPDADVPALASADEAARARRAFEIAPDALILAGSAEVPLHVSLGLPTAVADRHRSRFLVGLLGAVLSIGSAVVLAMSLGGTFR